MTTVACVWVEANVPFGAHYVSRLAAMVKRHMDRPYEFVCLTDRPSYVPKGVKAMMVPQPRGFYGWWSKIELFRPRRFEGRVLYLDLDTLVVDSLAPILDYPAQFALIPNAGTWQGKGAKKVVPKFNSSVMVFDADCNSHLYAQWSPGVTERLWGDQDWIGEQSAFATTMPVEWFPRVSELQDKEPDRPAKVVLVKKPKNDAAALRWPWVAEAWQ